MLFHFIPRLDARDILADHLAVNVAEMTFNAVQPKADRVAYFTYVLHPRAGHCYGGLKSMLILLVKTAKDIPSCD